MIKEGTPLTSAGDLGDSTAGNEPLWLSIAQGEKVVNDETFTTAGGSSEVRVKVLTLTPTLTLTLTLCPNPNPNPNQSESEGLASRG